MKKFFSLAVRSAAELKMERPAEVFFEIAEETDLMKLVFSVGASDFQSFESQLEFCSFEVW